MNVKGIYQKYRNEWKSTNILSFVGTNNIQIVSQINHHLISIQGEDGNHQMCIISCSFLALQFISILCLQAFASHYCLWLIICVSHLYISFRIQLQRGVRFGINWTHTCIFARHQRLIYMQLISYRYRLVLHQNVAQLM